MSLSELGFTCFFSIYVLVLSAAAWLTSLPLPKTNRLVFLLLLPALWLNIGNSYFWWIWWAIHLILFVTSFLSNKSAFGLKQIISFFVWCIACFALESSFGFPFEIKLLAIGIVCGFFPFQVTTHSIQEVLGDESSVFYFAAFPLLAIFFHTFDPVHHLFSESEKIIFLTAFLANGIYRCGRALVQTDEVKRMWALNFSQFNLILASAFVKDLAEVSVLSLVIAQGFAFFILQSCVIRIEKVRRSEGLFFPLGLSHRLPLTHRAFILAGLLLIGVPGTLTFVGEDFLFHTLLDFSPWQTAGLILITVLNAINWYFTYTRLFLDENEHGHFFEELSNFRGKALIAILVLVFGIGFFPQAWIHLIITK